MKSESFVVEPGCDHLDCLDKVDGHIGDVLGH